MGRCNALSHLTAFRPRVTLNREPSSAGRRERCVIPDETRQEFLAASETGSPYVMAYGPCPLSFQAVQQSGRPLIREDGGEGLWLFHDWYVAVDNLNRRVLYVEDAGTRDSLYIMDVRHPGSGQVSLTFCEAVAALGTPAG